MGLRRGLKLELKDEMINRIKKKLSEHDYDKKSGNPFIDVIFGKFSRQKTLTHGMATMFGSFYEKMAVKIAEDNPDFTVAKKHKISGKISPSERSVITKMTKDLEEKISTANYRVEVSTIYAADSTNREETSITIDLYLVDTNGKEYFIEMKGPDPNKKEVRAAKEEMMNIIAIKKPEVDKADFSDKVSVIFGVTYNNNPGVYDNWKVSRMYEQGMDLLVQEEFWELLGGPGTWGDILEIIAEVQVEVYPLIKDAMETKF